MILSARVDDSKGASQDQISNWENAWKENYGQATPDWEPFTHIGIQHEPLSPLAIADFCGRPDDVALDCIMRSADINFQWGSSTGAIEKHVYRHAIRAEAELEARAKIVPYKTFVIVWKLELAVSLGRSPTMDRAQKHVSRETIQIILLST